VCDELYGVHGLGLRTSALRALKDKMDRGHLTPIQMVRDNILPHFPPILHVRFQTRFRDPHEWFTARALFTRSTAVWSMFGHLVGLGDRHGENLLLHASGELCHCDFACMFDKGEALEVPERVRFRLTQNVVDAMGVTGTDGTFRRACELSLAVAAKHKAMIVGLLETFVHDPLVEWVAAARGTAASSSSSSSSRNNPKLLIARVVRRLDGHVDLYGDKDTVALSTEGQVTKLVHASRSLDALSRMYMWWMPWI
jgi:serine/threonine-protein kinase ATR